MVIRRRGEIMEHVTIARLRWLWGLSLLAATVAFGLSLLWLASPQGPGLDVIWGIAAFGAAALVYNIVFFLLCSIFAAGLSNLVEDDTEVHGDNVHHVVRHAETGDETSDFYIRAYATARAITATAIVSAVMITIALTFF